VGWPAAGGPVVTAAAAVEVGEVGAVVGAVVGVVVDATVRVVVGAVVGAVVGVLLGAGMVVERVGAVPPHAAIKHMSSDWSKSLFALTWTAP